MHNLFAEKTAHLRNQFVYALSQGLLEVCVVTLRLCATVLQLYTIKPRNIVAGLVTRPKDPKIKTRLLSTLEDFKSKMDAESQEQGAMAARNERVGVIERRYSNANHHDVAHATLFWPCPIFVTTNQVLLLPAAEKMGYDSRSSSSGSDGMTDEILPWKML